ncbi:MAG: hypothetical protein LBS90_06620 [Oscillospiraceae bacterium]|jgi:hypothetical protein|nr:hypothetical protein [Oscillospiraceae bacterium]
MEDRKRRPHSILKKVLAGVFLAVFVLLVAGTVLRYAVIEAPFRKLERNVSSFSEYEYLIAYPHGFLAEFPGFVQIRESHNNYAFFRYNPLTGELTRHLLVTGEGSSFTVDENWNAVNPDEQLLIDENLDVLKPLSDEADRLLALIGK